MAFGVNDVDEGDDVDKVTDSGAFVDAGEGIEGDSTTAAVGVSDEVDDALPGVGGFFNRVAGAGFLLGVVGVFFVGVVLAIAVVVAVVVVVAVDGSTSGAFVAVIVCCLLFVCFEDDAFGVAAFFPILGALFAAALL